MFGRRWDADDTLLLALILFPVLLLFAFTVLIVGIILAAGLTTPAAVGPFSGAGWAAVKAAGQV